MRATVRTPEIDEAIISGLSEGKPLAEICRDKDIGRSTVYDWQIADPDLAGRIARAREIGFDAIADACLEIADDSSLDVKIVGEDEREVCNTEFVQRAKLRIETRLKLLAKWDPKRYGDKIEHEHKGGVTITTGQHDADL
ncbi:terminase small subunit protein [Sphingomonas sp. SRS2]|uniref:terminase small subunit-like protein n=1 Tax=Sphingomonas sp. SRS2 TaxID=133190 RepID=UPI00128D5114|nr:terminase small subunit protein [Sphingomonas sp. SRS2]